MSFTYSDYYSILQNLDKQKQIIIKKLNIKNNSQTRLVNSYRIRLNKMQQAQNMYNSLSTLLISIPQKQLPPRVQKQTLKQHISVEKYKLKREINQIKSTYQLLNKLEAEKIKLTFPKL